SQFVIYRKCISTTSIISLSLHDALPIFSVSVKRVTRRDASSLRDIAGSGVEVSACRFLPSTTPHACPMRRQAREYRLRERAGERDRKSTRLNSSHVKISYAVFCLKKKIP